MTAPLGLCYVTHPQQPNHSGHSRGRAYHLREGSAKLSLCNMKFDRKPDKHMIPYGPCSGRYCKLCAAKVNGRETPKGWPVVQP